jgi:UDP-N-acetyl-D-mannosaminuronic acid dehydrogenase
VRLTPIEAEFAKLFCNAYRYAQFALANQFFMMTTMAGVDYYRVLEGLQRDYPRARGIPSAGLTAGPCLLKDTMQLSAFFGNQFGLGHMAMLVNEGVPLFISQNMLPRVGLERSTVGLLGMAFKANNDDTRSSLSYKLKKSLAMRVQRVLTTDPYVTDDPDLLPLEQVVLESDIVILCAPHEVYRHLNLSGKYVVDIWNHWQGRWTGPQSTLSSGPVESAVDESPAVT